MDTTRNFQVSTNGNERDIYVVNSKNELDARNVIDRMGAVDAMSYDLNEVELPFVVPTMFQNCIMNMATLEQFNGMQFSK